MSAAREPVTMQHVRERLEGRVGGRAERDLAFRLPKTDVAFLAAEKRAAVAAVLRDSGRGPEILLIRRAEHPDDPWSGHMAFPGGREDPGDPDLLGTAMRETLEELSLDLQRSARLLGALDELPAVARGKRTGLTIAPFVFELTEEPALTLNYEVAEVLWAPLEGLLRGEFATTYPYTIEGQEVRLPAHNVEGRLVWGLTGRMLDSLLALLR
jgi:8-oxo-dGTP pyrophosphatase MutT (NUDIX family)